METAKGTTSDFRELTASERQIAIAQIADRFKRLKLAHRKADMSISKLSEGWDGYEQCIESAWEEFDIPKGVAYIDECDWTSLTHQIMAPLFRFWVQGILHKEECEQIAFWFSEVEEFDFGWVFMDRPTGYYGAGGIDCIDQENIAEFIRIGSRAKRKHKGDRYETIFQFARP